MSVDLPTLQAQLERWAADRFGAGVTVAGLEAMPGHAGLSFGFRVLDPAGVCLDDLVMRMPPKGVRRRGNTDVLRQVPLLQALRAAGVPVAEVRHWSDDESWFEVPFFMVGRLPGETYIVRKPDPRVAAWGLGPDEVFGQAVEALALVHTFDWRSKLASWEEPRDLVDEIHYWDPILAKAAEPDWVGMGERTRDLLLANVPADPQVGVFHGDFQTNNILYDAGGLVAVLDWEISGIGAQLLDLGWLIMMNDPLSWHHDGLIRDVPSFDGVVERYAAASGRAVTLDDVAWYRALAGYRFGVITGLNVMLHRTGKRVDPEWEHIARSAPALFGRAADLLTG
jgi:aminoglycoside phosphotransferase (APT) family kinase protein